MIRTIPGRKRRRKIKRIGSLGEFFAASPLRGSGIKVRRSKRRALPVNL